MALNKPQAIICEAGSPIRTIWCYCLHLLNNAPGNDKTSYKMFLENNSEEKIYVSHTITLCGWLRVTSGYVIGCLKHSTLQALPTSVLINPFSSIPPLPPFPPSPLPVLQKSPLTTGIRWHCTQFLQSGSHACLQKTHDRLPSAPMLSYLGGSSRQAVFQIYFFFFGI